MTYLENHTVTEFIIMGLLKYTPIHLCLFALITIIFLVTLTGNSLLILVILVDPHLHTPMYFFLWQLSLIDVLFTLAIVPKMMMDYPLHKRVIFLPGCGIQIFLGLALGGTECILLGLMSYDRYVAICKPLHYPLLMNWSLCRQMTFSSWISGTFNALIHTIYTMRFPFCGFREIHHFYCELPVVLQLSCEDTLAYESGVLISTTILLLIPFSVILASYTLILVTIIQMSSTEGQKKAFSTCSSHLTVVSLYYGAIIFMYMRPISSHTFSQDKVVSVLYTILTPMLNPMIYSLRNKDVMEALKKILWKCALYSKM
ncbi:olfactory receptor 2AJ1-like [Hippopotamus amphibius kiboko]|uniref:olfactory receptor 2AJ1-like n=1 Tax=Hippopotamus amphibius kiboko TaxID=575201 RepID=UPI0025993B00|nr:olfactory receptor 2AJ1-like [Hippopotamus amphibius kiboko]